MLDAEGKNFSFSFSSFLLNELDMIDTIRADEKSVMTYVSAYYHAFAEVYKVFKK